MIVLFQDGDSASPTGDDNLSRIQQGSYCIQFYNLNRMRSGDYTTEALSGFLDDIISFFAFFRV